MNPVIKAIVIFLSLFICFNPVSAAKKEITIIHTNDLHSQFLGFSPNQDYTPDTLMDDETLGGYARISTLIQKIRAQAKGPVLVLDGGDFLMGSFFHTLTRERAFELELLGLLGYDAVVLGNHEFDMRPKGLARILNTVDTLENRPAILSANMIFSKESTEDDTLEKAVADGLVTPYTIIEKDGVKFGIFGLMGMDAAEKAPFSKPVTFSDPVAVAQKMVETLKGKADVIICLSHGGLNKDSEKSEDELLAQKVNGIDVIISGHTHTKMAAPIQINNTLVVQTWEYGKQVGHIRLALEDGKVSVSDYQAVEIDDSIPGDKKISEQIAIYEDLIDREFLKEHGTSFRKIVARTDFDLMIKEEESTIGNFIADSIRFVRKKYSEDFNPFADVVMISNGVIRDHLLKGKTGNILACDLFRVLPLGIGMDDSLGYPLISIYITLWS